MSFAGPLDGAKWLRHPVFAEYQPLGVFDTFKTVESKKTPLSNVHTYFRKDITLPAAPVRAVATVTADDLYTLYINGEFADHGPARTYPFVHPYVEVDVTPLLREGKNCIAAHTYYHGVATRAFNSADNRAGFLLKLELTMPDGSRTVVTDESWRCLRSPTFSSDKMFGYQTQFNENMDLRAEPAGWRLSNFDDAGWETPLVDRQDHTFVPSPIPTLERWRAEPVIAKEKEPGRWFYDFGQEIAGHTRIAVRGEAGHVMTVWHGEELSAPETVRHDMRANCDYSDQITLSGREDLVEFYDYRAFRYVEILDAPEPPEVWVDVRHYPLDKSKVSLESSDEQLNAIWKICVEAIRMGCQSVITDCPTREKGQYTGDTYMTVLTQLLLTGDPALARKAIREFQYTQRYDDGLLCVAPGGFWQELAEWSLLWPVMLEYYYQMTGDEALVREMIDEGALRKLYAWFEGMESERGLLTGMDEKKWVLVDWPRNLRGDYDYDGTKNTENTVVNAFYYRSLRAAAALMRTAGLDGDAYDARAERVKAAMAEHLLNAETNLFRDGSGSENYALHATGYPLCFGAIPDGAIPQAIGLLRERRLDCGIYGAPYFIEGAYRAREAELAYDLMISNQDERSWYEMVRSGATAAMEAWGPDQKWNTSWCHPAGATPIYLFITHTLGIQSGEAGWKSVRLDPQLPEGLDWVSLRFPTVRGEIAVDYKRGEHYRITVPAGVAVETAPECTLNVSVEHAG